LATISLVGYTNAGKSSLFNRVTNASVTADSRMFATLDPTVRHVMLPSNRKVLFSDTVGFIRHLPTTLVKAFRATLEEVVEASLLLHVVDVSSDHAAQHTAHVLNVLAEIGADSTPQLLVFNKLDLLPESEADIASVCSRVLGNTIPPETRPSAVAVSAKTGKGLEELMVRIDSMIPLDQVSRCVFHIPHADGGALHFVYEYGRVLDKTEGEEYSEVVADVPESIRKRLAAFVAPGGNEPA
jgi:GTP-binding protein HflX